MRNLLVVDDERNIRLGLKAMIERRYSGRFSIMTAEQGQEAWELMKETPIDIVMTDIRMPVMDGIALINRIHESERKPLVIILSGHDEFAYAKEAIRCEVKQYLLKPIVREELFGTLERLDKELDRREDLSQKLRESERQSEDYRQSVLNLVLLNPAMSGGEMRSRLLDAGLAWMDQGYQIALLKPLQQVSGLQPQAGEGLFARMMAGFEGQGEYEQAVFQDKDGRPVLISSSRELSRFVSDYALDQQFPMFRIGISEWCEGMENMKEAYGQAAKALKYSFLQPNPGAVEYVCMKGREEPAAIPLPSVQKIANMLGSDREKEMKSLLYEIMDLKVVARYDISYLEKLASALNEQVFDKVFHMYGEESIEILKLYKKVGHIYNYEHYHDYLHGVESLLMRLNEYIKTMKAAHVDRREMQRALDYIQVNYQRDLNMAMVANHISLSYTYFSESFKQFTGDSFPHYLKKVRIDNAKRLLETTDDKVYEIGRLTGFENTKHFNRVFKELEGVTPQEYRSQRRVLGEV
ncbi:MAG: two component AraC family transcriptional regulator [Paenibacillaceae bacterium]|jgi:two-component system response regulator YesN|nr:two component AraC family transcriptional regulator [Paenibacillaceae bacterium]